jgi:hypothetical protein
MPVLETGAENLQGQNAQRRPNWRRICERREKTQAQPAFDFQMSWRRATRENPAIVSTSDAIFSEVISMRSRASDGSQKFLKLVP